MKAFKEIKKGQPTLNEAAKTDIEDYSNDPFFIKKRERAKEFIDKHGIPEHFLKKVK